MEMHLAVDLMEPNQVQDKQDIQDKQCCLMPTNKIMLSSKTGPDNPTSASKEFLTMPVTRHQT